jgi:hypothetical protein
MWLRRRPNRRDELVREDEDSLERRDTQGVVSLFVKDAEYREDPFGEPLRGEGAIRAYWADAARSQRDIKVSYELLSAHIRVGIVRWRQRLSVCRPGKRSN